MTDIKLLPLPEPNIGLPGQVKFAYSPDLVDKAIRANVEAATAKLRAEVERLKSMTAVTMGVGSGDGSLFVHSDYDSIKATQALVFRAERLAEALREAADMLLADYPETAKRLRAEADLLRD